MVIVSRVPIVPAYPVGWQITILTPPWSERFRNLLKVHPRVSTLTLFRIHSMGLLTIVPSMVPPVPITLRSSLSMLRSLLRLVPTGTMASRNHIHPMGTDLGTMSRVPYEVPCFFLVP